MKEDFTKYIDMGIAFANDFIAKHGPDAWEMVRTIKQVDSIQHIVFTLIMTLIVLCLVKFVYGVYNLADKDRDRFEDIKDKYVAALVSSAIAIIILGPITVGMYLSVWSWIGLFYPDMAIAHDVLTKVTK